MPFLDFDTSQVPALQESNDSKFARLVQATGAPILTQNEARGEIGFEPVGNGTADELPQRAAPQDGKNGNK